MMPMRTPIVSKHHAAMEGDDNRACHTAVKRGERQQGVFNGSKSKARRRRIEHRPGLQITEPRVEPPVRPVLHPTTVSRRDRFPDRQLASLAEFIRSDRRYPTPSTRLSHW